jgi:hypothetical protein
MRDDKQKSQPPQQSGKSMTRETSADAESDEDSELEDDDMDMDDEDEDEEADRVIADAPAGENGDLPPMSARHEAATGNRITRDDGDNDDEGELK